MCSSSDDVDDEDYMENTMCSSSDDVDDENYWKNKKMENTMRYSSDDVDGEDLQWRLKTKSDTNAKNYSETEEILKVSLDHELSKENLERTIQLKRVVPKFYPTMCRNEWLKTRTKMQCAISIKSMMRLFSAHTLSLLKWTV